MVETSPDTNKLDPIQLYCHCSECKCKANGMHLAFNLKCNKQYYLRSSCHGYSAYSDAQLHYSDMLNIMYEY